MDKCDGIQNSSGESSKYSSVLSESYSDASFEELSDSELRVNIILTEEAIEYD